MALTVARTSTGAVEASAAGVWGAEVVFFPGCLLGNIVAQLGDGVEIAQFKVFRDLEAEALGDLAEDFDLLDGVDAQIGLQVEGVFEHVGGVAGLLGDDGFDRGQDVDGCRGSFGRRGLGGGSRVFPGRFLGNIVAQLGDGVEIAQFKVFGDLEAEALGDLAEDFDLLDGVDAQIGLQVEGVFEHVGGIAGLLGDDGLDRV